MPLPSPATPSSYLPPKVTTFDLSNGITVWYLHSTRVPLTTLRLITDGGALFDGPDQAGLASMTARMLLEGTPSHNALEIADAFERLAASVSPFATHDTAEVHLQVLSRNLDPSLALVADLVRNASFPPEELERVRKIWLSRLQQRGSDPHEVARLVSSRAFFGDDYAYAQPLAGFAPTIASLTAEDLHAFKTTHYRPEHTRLVIVSDLEQAALLALLESHLGDWQPDGAAAPRTAKATSPLPQARREPALVLVHKAEAPQSLIRILLPGRASGDPALAGLDLINTVFGGAFTSRLMQNLREDKGYTYGARSQFNSARHDGIFVASAAVDTEATGPALKEFLYEFGRLASGDLSEAELLRAKASRSAELAQTFESQDGALATYASLASARLPAETLHGWISAAEAYDLEQINALSQEITRLDQAVIVVVGDLHAIAPQLEGLGLPTPEYRDAEGQPCAAPSAP